MSGTCQFSFGQRSGAAEWSFDGSSLVVTPEGGPPLNLGVKELAGISGDEYMVKALVPGMAAAGTPDYQLQGRPTELVLSRLGHDGPTLGESLRREWLKARTEVLRLGGSGEGWHACGQVAGFGSGVLDSGGAPELFNALLFEDVLVVAREGRDLEPVFLALVETVTFDEATYAVHVEEWPGRKLVFSKLAKQTDEFVKRLRENRALLAKEAAATLTAATPGLPADARGAVAGTWMPGRLMELARMNAACPGFEAAFRGEWLPRLLRREEGSHLLEWASSASSWLGCTREAGGASGTAGGEAGEAAGTGAGADRGGDGEQSLWMLSGKKNVWFLEALSIEDRATYCFKGGDELPALISRLLCAPQFSKEALYSPLEELAGESADLAIPARFLGFLVELRSRFQDRVIHQSPEGWRKEVDKLG
jgi:hypothetical protein